MNGFYFLFFLKGCTEMIKNGIYEVLNMNISHYIVILRKS